jgi:hypothetical protein
MTGIRPAFHFTPEDFASIEDHLARWRFDDDVLPHVRLLTTTTGRTVHHILAQYLSNRAYALSEQYFSAVEARDTSGDEAPVAAWLQRHDPDAAQDVIVSHGSKGVYVVTWGLFCARWSSFCQPASDDVVIAPLTEAWILMYYHEEEFFWGRPIHKVP